MGPWQRVIGLLAIIQGAIAGTSLCDHMDADTSCKQTCQYIVSSGLYPKWRYDEDKCITACKKVICTQVSDACGTAIGTWVNETRDFSSPSQELRLIEADYTSAKSIQAMILVFKGISNLLAKSDSLDWTSLQYQNLKSFGNYDACNKISGAQYCLTKFPLDPSGNVAYGPWATCVPNECTANDINKIYNATAYTLLSFAFANVTLDPSMLLGQFPPSTTCGDNSYGWNSGAGIMVGLLTFFGVITVGATTYLYVRSKLEERKNDKGYKELSHVDGDREGINTPAAKKKQPKDLGTKILSAISLTTSFDSFLKLRTGTGTEAMEGVRVFSMMWVVFGHCLAWPFAKGPGYANIYDAIPYNGNDKAWMATWIGQVIKSSEFAVDTFFFMSGFLAAFISLRKLRGRTSLDVAKSSPMLYLNRWLRITPMYMIVIFTYTYVFPMMISGPLVDQSADVEMCKNNWWYNFLYVQTVFPRGVDNKNIGFCYRVSWYLADDMMFFWATPWLLAVFLYNKIAGFVVPSFLCVASIAAGWVIAWKRHLRFATFDQSLYNDFYYLPPWTRAPPYLLGIIFGMFYFEFKTRKMSIPKNMQTILQMSLGIFAAILFGSTVYGSHEANQNVPSGLSYAKNNAYIALAKPAWSIALTIMLFLCFENLGGPVQWFLSLPFFGYISKLTFCMYLLHPIVLSLMFFERVAPMRLTVVNFSVHYIAAIVATAALAFVVNLFVEAPLAGLQRILMSYVMPVKPKSERRKEATDWREAKGDGPSNSKDDVKKSEM